MVQLVLNIIQDEVLQVSLTTLNIPQHVDVEIRQEVHSRSKVKESLGQLVSIRVLLDVGANELYKYALLACLLYTSPSPRDRQKSRMPSSA